MKRIVSLSVLVTCLCSGLTAMGAALDSEQAPTTTFVSFVDEQGGGPGRQEPANGADTLFLPRAVKVESRTGTVGPRGHVSCGLKDKAGRLWFGTSEGLVRFDGGRFTRFIEVDSLRPARGYANWEHIYSIFEDRAGHIWFGAPNGVYRYDGKTFASWAIPARDFKDLNDYPDAESRVSNPLPPTAVISILQDKRGTIWFGTWGGGVNRYDGKALTNLSVEDGLCNNVVQGIVEDRNENLWFATRGGGVCRYDGRSFTTYATKGDASSYHVFFIAADSAGTLWIGTVGELRRFDGTGFTPVTEPDLMNVTCMLQARTGERWFGSDGSGVCRSDGRSFTRFTTKDGLCSNAVWGILEDNGGRLWFCTRKGLCRYDGTSFTSFAER